MQRTSLLQIPRARTEAKAPAPRERGLSSTRRVLIPAPASAGNRAATLNCDTAPAKLPRVDGKSQWDGDADAISLVIAQLHKLPEIYAKNQRWPNSDGDGDAYASDYNGAVFAASAGLIAWIFERDGDGGALLCDGEKTAMLRQLSGALLEITDANLDVNQMFERLASVIKKLGTTEQQDRFLRDVEDRLLVSN